MKADFWNKRYADSDFLYGRQPNTFFKSSLQLLAPGKILLPCEGEGRNAIHAAKSGWEVTATDFSKEAKEKAIQLAREVDAVFDYVLGDLDELSFPSSTFDALGLIYAHFPVQRRLERHQKLSQNLKVGGWVLLEAFSPSQLGRGSGGPKVAEMLYTPEMLAEDFAGFEIHQNEIVETELDEGKGHQGKASVVRFRARKRHEL